MDLTLHMAEEVASSLPKKLYSRIFQETLAAARFRTDGGFRLSGKKVTLHAVAVSERKIKKLNATYRRRDKATDILSFGQENWADQGKEIFLGELFFSPPYIRRQAKAGGVPYREAMIYIFSHGILHLMGYDHSKKMFAYQNDVTDLLTGFPKK